jgi:hypothetical protein
MKYTVVHSKDPYLLARLATDLQMSGVEDKDDCVIDEETNYIAHYSKSFFTGRPAYQFHHAPFRNNELAIELTSRNYINVLTQILEP